MAQGKRPPTQSPNKRPILSWHKNDIEKKLCLPAGKYTTCRCYLPLTLGLLVSFIFLLLAWGIQLSVNHGTLLSRTAEMFVYRGAIPYFQAFLFFWSMSILLVKYTKIRFQKKSLSVNVVPDDHDFVVSPDTVNIIIDKIERSVDDPERFILFSRIKNVLMNLKNIGRISDVEDSLSRQSETIDDIIESSYNTVRAFIWAIPVLGFIGTVIGLSDAIGSFGMALSQGEDISGLRKGLEEITGGLSLAFDTTFIGLVLALIVQMSLNPIKNFEESLLDECKEYCHNHVVARLRVLPLENDS